MPKKTFSSANVRGSDTKFPQLKLEKMGDYARVKLAEAEPTFEWVHTLRKPKLSAITGELLTRTITVGKGDDQQEKIVPDMDFVGTPICFGTDEALEDRGFDPDHCIICKAVQDHPDYFDRPERKWAVHVLKYATQGNSTKAVQPLQFEVRVWRMSEGRYGRVVSVLEEFAEQVGGDLLKVDLTLGPCNNAKFQNYDVQGSPVCALAQNEAKWREAEETFASNNAGDLSAYCGRKADPKFVKNDIDEIVTKWQAAKMSGGQDRAQAAAASPDFAGTLASSNLVDAPARPTAVPESTLSDLDSTVGAAEPEVTWKGETEEVPAEETPASPPVSRTETVPATPASGTASFASLMNAIGVAQK